MIGQPARLLLALASLMGLVACTGGGGSSSSGRATLAIRASYQKRAMTPSGPAASLTQAPARFCFAEVRDSGSGNVLASGYLGVDGMGYADLPDHSRVFVLLYASYQVPTLDSSSTFVFRGSVLKSDPSTTYNGAPAQATDWNYDSQDLTLDGDRGVDVVVPELAQGLRPAGAFAIADQAVGLGMTLRDVVEPNLRLPNLHAVWNPNGNPGSRTYPRVLFNGSAVQKSAEGRAMFSCTIPDDHSGAANSESDDQDSAVLRETFAHLLFADYSYKPDGSSSYSLLRRDNDDAYVSRKVASQADVAFTDGFADFLAAATGNDSRILDSYVDGSGTLQVDAFDLSRHDQVPSGVQSEFSRGSVAVSLWGIWQHALHGDADGLRVLWNAIRYGQTYADGTGEYNGAAWGTFPTYLQGVKSQVSAGTWSTVLNELAFEQIPNPDATYFTSNRLWIDTAIPSSQSGTLQTYDPSQGIYYDLDQGATFRFVQGSTATRTITLTPTGGQDFFLELIGPGGLYQGSYGAPAASTRIINATSLPGGVYVVRVRAGNTTATGTAGYSLSIQ